MKNLFWLDPANETSSFCEFIGKNGDIVNIKQFGSEIEVFDFELFELVKDEATNQPLYFKNINDFNYLIKLTNFNVVEEVGENNYLREIFSVFMKDDKPFVTLLDLCTGELIDVSFIDLIEKTFILEK